MSATTSTSTVEEVAEQRDALVGRIFGATLGAMDLFSIYLGDRLGLYRSLATAGAATPVELADRTATAERYVREWLEQQAVTGILEVEENGTVAAARRYRLPAGHAEVLLNPESLAYLAPVSRFMGSLAGVLPALLQAFRTGDGVPWSAYGEDGREGQAALNRPLFINVLGQEWLPSIPDLHARLQSDPPARVADIGCGAGWSSIAIARAYPKVHVDGFDSDEPSLLLARTNAAEAGVADHVTFHDRDVSALDLAGQYDLVTAFECIHDMPRPVEALRTMRRLAGANGVVLVMDERVCDTFTAPGDDIERFMYGASILCCLPVGMSDSPSAATGTVMRAGTFQRYATEAGFRAVEVLPIEHDFFRVYRLTV